MSWKDAFVDLTRRAQRQLRTLTEGRERLSDAEYYQRFFAESGIAESTVAEVRQLFAHTLGDIFYLIYPDDDWGGEFRVLWDLDSMANVELVMDMEEVFGVTISEAEANAMTSLRKTVTIITTKLARTARSDA